MNKILEILIDILLLPFVVLGLIVTAIMYIFSKDDEKAIIQGIGKGYVDDDLRRFYEE